MSDGAPMKTYEDSVIQWNLNKFCRRIGVPIPCHYCNQLWCVQDCAGYTGAGFTLFLIFVGELMVTLTLLSRQWSVFTLGNALLSFFCAFLGTAAHFRAMFSDPVSLFIDLGIVNI